jgi:hypothetical protein
LEIPKVGPELFSSSLWGGLVNIFEHGHLKGKIEKGKRQAMQNLRLKK